VKPVVLLSQTGIGDRLEGVRSIAATLTQFVGDKVESFAFIFNKGQGEEIHNKLKELLRQKERTGDNKSVMQLLRAIVQQTKPPHILAPIEDDASTMLQDLCESGVISDPAESFSTFVSSESLQTLVLQLGNHRKSISLAIRERKLPLLRYKLDDLRLALELLDLVPIASIYNRCVQEVATFMNKFCERVLEVDLKRAFTDGEWQEQDRQALFSDLDLLVQLEKIRQFHTALIETDSLSDLKTSVEHGILLQLRNVADRFHIAVNGGSDAWCQELLLQQLRKACYVVYGIDAELHAQVQVELDGILGYFRSKFDSIEGKAKRAVDVMNVAAFAKLLREGNLAWTNGCEFLTTSHLEEVSEYLVAAYTTKIEGAVLDLDVYFSETTCSNTKANLLELNTVQSETQ
jgi:predicted nucleotidyltransferase